MCGFHDYGWFKVTYNEDSVRVMFNEPVKVISSAVLNGGLSKTKSIVNLKVTGEELSCTDPKILALSKLNQIGLGSDTVCLMTSADTSKASVIRKYDEQIEVVSIITLGLSHASSAGDYVKNPHSNGTGTINIIVIIDCDPTDSCLVNCLSTIAEAKARALKKLSVMSKYSFSTATGTVTDAVAVACSERGERVEYAGPATRLGRLISSAVIEATVNAARSQDITPNRGVLNRLSEIGINLRELVDSGVELFHPSERISSREDAKKLLERAILDISSDVNVASLIFAAILLDEAGMEGALPNMSKEYFISDPVDLLADESIGIAIADYIAGSRAIHNFKMYESRKPGVISKLPPFLDDAISGLIAGAMTKIHID